MSAFEFDYIFSTSASESNVYTVFGETVQPPETPDQTLVVSVPLVKLKGLLTVADGWTSDLEAKIKSGEQTFPTLTLSLAGASDEITPIDSALRAFSESVDKPMFSDSNAMTDKKSLQAYLHDASELTSTTAANDWLLSIPAIAIRATDVSQTQAAALTELIVPLTVGNTDETSQASMGGAIRGLFEQMVNANKVNSNTGALDLVSGDAISFYVNYSLDKTYAFNIDQDVSSTGASQGAANFTIGGESKQLPTTGLSVSATGVKKMQWRFVAA